MAEQVKESVKAGLIRSKLKGLGNSLRSSFGIVPDKEEEKEKEEVEEPLTPPKKKKKSAQENIKDVVKSFKSWED